MSIGFSLPAPGDAVLAVFDAGGRRVSTLVHGHLEGGPQVATWDGKDETGREVPSGLYLLRLDALGARRAVKLALVR
jgi:flagellar hook assembly protein FlgD